MLLLLMQDLLHLQVLLIEMEFSGSDPTEMLVRWRQLFARWHNYLNFLRVG